MTEYIANIDEKIRFENFSLRNWIQRENKLSAKTIKKSHYYTI
jgi:hypothetical protein